MDDGCGINNKKQIDYKLITEKLCTERTREGMKRRSEIFEKFDINKNGLLTLRECDLGVKNVLNMPEIAECKPVIFKAFEAAKRISRNTNDPSKNFVEKNEFRYFLCYLRQYFEFYQMFSQINSNSNLSISFEEFCLAIPLIEKWGYLVKDPKASFNEMDADNSGLVKFDEFCSWAIKKNLDVEDDDDFTDQCLKNLK